MFHVERAHATTAEGDVSYPLPWYKIIKQRVHIHIVCENATSIKKTGRDPTAHHTLIGAKTL